MNWAQDVAFPENVNEEKIYAKLMPSTFAPDLSIKDSKVSYLTVVTVKVTAVTHSVLSFHVQTRWRSPKSTKA